MRKRMLSWLLVLTMLLSCLPVSAFAAEEQGEAVDEIVGYIPEKGDVIYIPGTPAKGGEISEGYVLNCDTPGEGMEIVTPNTVCTKTYKANRSA